MDDTENLSQVIKLQDDICAQEQIHIPGSIQPHGLLIGLEAQTLRLLTKSANVEVILGLTPQCEIPPWLPLSVIELCRTLEESQDRVLLVKIAGIGLTEVHCFFSSGIVFCEFEVETIPRRKNTEINSIKADDAVRQMSAATGMSALSELAAEAIRALSGFERVLIYRFDEEGNGDAIGESLVSGWGQSLLGLRFPSSDIPRQARELYRITSSRWMPTRDYQAVLLDTPLDPSGRPFDLRFSRYRSVSPVHRMYQRNLDIDGSMSVSVMRDGILWGLVIGHHRKPHHVPEPIRRDVIRVTQAFALRVDVLLSRETGANVAQGMRSCLAMLRKLAGADDFLGALTKGEPQILDLLPGCSGVAVVWDSGKKNSNVFTMGKTCPDNILIDLAEWIKSNKKEPVFYTECLSNQLSYFSRHRDVASGVLSCSFKDNINTMLLFFRPEVIRTVSWAGKPEKLVGLNSIPSLPRRSFERWVEVKRGHSDTWLPWERDIAVTICATVNDVIVRQHRISEELRILARIDPLTELFNRRAFSEAAEIEFLRCRRFKSTTSVLMIDGDNFKQINDLYGHEAGDAALVSIANALRMSARATDIPARFGGEEFVLLLIGSDIPGALEKSERIRRTVEQTIVASRSDTFSLTVSIGIAEFSNDDQDWSDAIARADQAMYRAKELGRNRVVCYGDLNRAVFVEGSGSK